MGFLQTLNFWSLLLEWERERKKKKKKKKKRKRDENKYKRKQMPKCYWIRSNHIKLCKSDNNCKYNKQTKRKEKKTSQNHRSTKQFTKYRQTKQSNFKKTSLVSKTNYISWSIYIYNVQNSKVVTEGARQQHYKLNRREEASFLTSRKEGNASLKASSSFSSSVLESPCNLSLKWYSAASSSSFCRRLSSCSCHALTNRSRTWVKVLKRSGVSSPDCKACVFSSSREQLSNL